MPAAESGSAIPAGSGPAEALPVNARAVRDAAAELGLAIEVVSYPDGTRTAADAAAAIGCQVAQIVKSLIFVAGEAVTVALVSGANQLDERKLSRAAGTGKARRADADQVRAATGFPIGGVPPFGHPRPLPVFLDEELLQHPVVWAAAGTPHTVFAVAPHELCRVTGAVVADLKRA
jgi:Cys-tRNA(Pro) deacylase